MEHIVVDEREAALIEQAEKRVQVLNTEGQVIGYITPAPSSAELTRWRERLLKEEPTYTTAEVLAHLRSLESQRGIL